jgi:hypothetical protein
MQRLILAVLALFVACLGTPSLAQTALNAELKAGKAVGQNTLRVKQGDDVTLTVASDRPIVLHLHGYDIQRTAEPDKPAVFSFTAKATGRFSISAVTGTAKDGKGHSHGTSPLYIEVMPR